MIWSSRVKCNGGKWYSVLFQDKLEEKVKGDRVVGGVKQGEEKVTERVSVKQG